MVKYGKYTLAKFANFVYFLLRTEKPCHIGQNLPEAVRRAHYKNVQNLQTLQAHIFHIVQYFANKLRNFEMLFLAAVTDFVLGAKMKIRFRRGYGPLKRMRFRPWFSHHVSWLEKLKTLRQ